MCCFFFFKQKTSYEMRISDWSSDVCSSDLTGTPLVRFERPPWRAQVGDRWTEVADVDAAARAVVALGATRVLLTIGRTGLDAFRPLDQVRSEARRVGKECVSTFNSRWSP